MDMSIVFLKSAYDRSPSDLGIVMLTSHVDETGKASTLQKRIEGMVAKPVAGSLVAPLIKCKISAIDTSVNRSPFMSMQTVPELYLTFTFCDIFSPMHDNCLLKDAFIAAFIRISYIKTIQNIIRGSIKCS